MCRNRFVFNLTVLQNRAREYLFYFTYRFVQELIDGLNEKNSEIQNEQ